MHFQKRLARRCRLILLYSALILVALFVLSPIVIFLIERRRIYSKVENVSGYKVAVVFGAGIRNNTNPTAPLEDRLLLTYNLYKSHKVEKILVSGDNRVVNYNEPKVMKEYLVKLGVKSSDIYEDFAGHRTYDTCYRAKNIFGVDKAILISQGFHLPRSIFLCNSLGVESYGAYSVGVFSTHHSIYHEIREVIAIYKAVLDVLILKPKVVGGDKTKIE